MNIYMTRQPIFNSSSATDAYEILYHINSPNAAENGGDDILTPAELEEARETLKNTSKLLIGKKKAYVRFTPQMLEHNFYELFQKNMLIIEASTDILSNPTALQKLLQIKRGGYTICLKDFLYSDDRKELFRFADIVRFSINSDAEKIETTVDMCKNNGKLCFADDVNTQDLFEYTREAGIDYLQGYFYSQPILETKRSGGPMIKTFLQILALLYSPDPNIEYLAAVISTDPVLTIKLLRLINQLCADTGNTVSTVHQALVMLGIDKLKEWIYIVGLQRLNRSAPNELLQLALFRAGFCERLSRNLGGVGVERSKEMYLMGLISIITGTSGAALAKALDDLPVSDEIKSGLTGGGGVYSDIYNLASSFERGDWAKADGYAEAISLEKQLLPVEYINTLQFVQKYGKFSS